MKKEIYIDIKGYEGLYQVSNYGNIKSLPRKKMQRVYFKAVLSSIWISACYVK